METSGRNAWKYRQGDVSPFGLNMWHNMEMTHDIESVMKWKEEMDAEMTRCMAWTYGGVPHG